MVTSDVLALACGLAVVLVGSMLGKRAVFDARVKPRVSVISGRVLSRALRQR